MPGAPGPRGAREGERRGVELEPRVSESAIRGAVARIARAIEADLAREGRTEPPLLVGVLKGSFVFLADLVRELDVDADVDFMRARAYGADTRPGESVEITKDLETDAAGRDVIIVEDIADTGGTMRAVASRIARARPASLRRCALLVREGDSPPVDEPDYAGIRIGPGFVVGYGLDHAERYRGLPDIRFLRRDGAAP